jgi:predicted nuclease of predicted toxin-antitoxin system
VLYISGGFHASLGTTLWIDAQLSPLIAVWIQEVFQIESRALRDIGIRDATDMEIFNAPKNATAVIITKDRDFVTSFERYGASPQVFG